MKQKAKEHKAEARHAANEKGLKAARESLPDNDRFAWYKIIGGGGTNHNLTGIHLVVGRFAYLQRKLADQADTIYELAKKEAK